MEIGDNFASLIKKVRASRVPEDIKDILTGELNTIRNKVFRYIQEETSVSREDKKEHDSVNHPQYYCSHPENKGELIISNISEISLSFKDNLLSLQIKY